MRPDSRIIKSVCVLTTLYELFGQVFAGEAEAMSKMGEISYTRLRDKTVEHPELEEYLEPTYTVPFLIRRDGYPAEEHVVQTEDGYLLTLHRIRGPEGSAPVLLQHGLTGSSANWIVSGKGRALGYILADLGYDVWLGNYRGNRYSRGHVSMSSNILNAEYWDFSWDEAGYYDLPAEITYITELTGKPLEAYVGHSMGCTGYYVMGTLRPEFQEKVKIMVSLAPGVCGVNTRGPTRMAVPFVNEILLFAHTVGLRNNPPLDSIVRPISQILCTNNDFLTEICKIALFSIMGYDFDQFDDSLLKKITTFDISSMPAKMFIHYGQGIASGHFRRYDHGPEINMKLYNSTEPPDYDLSKLTSPIVLIYGENDYLAGPEDVEKFGEKLPNVVDSFKVAHPDFNHIDFLWAKDVVELVYNRMIYDIQHYQTGLPIPKK